MSEVPFSIARKTLTHLVNKVLYLKERVILTRKGKTVAVLISPEDFSILMLAKEKELEGKKTSV